MTYPFSLKCSRRPAIRRLTKRLKGEVNSIRFFWGVSYLFLGLFQSCTDREPNNTEKMASLISSLLDNMTKILNLIHI